MFSNRTTELKKQKLRTKVIKKYKNNKFIKKNLKTDDLNANDSENIEIFLANYHIYNENSFQNPYIYDKIDILYSKRPNTVKDNQSEFKEFLYDKEKDILKRFYEEILKGNMEKASKNKIRNYKLKETSKTPSNQTSINQISENNIKSDSKYKKESDVENKPNNYDKMTLFLNDKNEVIFSDYNYAEFFSKNYVLDYLEAFKVNKFDLKKYILKNFNIQLQNCNLYEINELTLLLLNLKMFYFDFFLKIGQSINIDDTNITNVTFLEINKKLCDIIENNKKSVLILVPLCFSYPTYFKNIKKILGEVLELDIIVYIYILYIFETIVSFDWKTCFRNFFDCFIASENFYIRNKGGFISNLFFLRSNCEFLFLKLVFFVRVQIEINKMFLFLAKSNLCTDTIDKYIKIANYNNIVCFLTLNLQTFEIIKGELLLTKNNSLLLSPFFFITMCLNNNKINVINAQAKNLNFHCICNSNKTAEKDKIRHFFFYDLTTDRLLMHGLYTKGYLFKVGNQPKFPNFVFIIKYFREIEEFLQEHVKIMMRAWEDKLKERYDFMTLSYIKKDDKTGANIQLSKVDIREINNLIYNEATKIIDLSSIYYYGKKI